MTKVFKNPEEAKKALEKAGWYVVRTKKHLVMKHGNYPHTLLVPKKHRYLSKRMEQKFIKALKKTSEEWRRK
ncbi:MAG: type II toxin-antitoxin system HicA family toxin [Candidatus Eremiobacteraeota bacterium]|nr:type II toxin-antitoxin system HicA family toxin [Candidatus Eremiobacteraeota bacterium]